MVARLAVLLALAAAVTFAGPAEDAIRAEIRVQQDAWNKGDIQAFMASYEKSPDVLYVGTAVVRGYDAILKRYLDRYPDRSKMGQVAFSGVEIRLLGPDWASVLGQWSLSRAQADGGNVGGNFTLLFRKTPRGWRIVVDHTTQAPAAR